MVGIAHPTTIANQADLISQMTNDQWPMTPQWPMTNDQQRTFTIWELFEFGWLNLGLQKAW